MKADKMLRVLVEFAYERGFHELGYDVVDAAQQEARAAALEEAAKHFEALQAEVHGEGANKTQGLVVSGIWIAAQLRALAEGK